MKRLVSTLKRPMVIFVLALVIGISYNRIWPDATSSAQRSDAMSGSISDSELEDKFRYVRYVEVSITGNCFMVTRTRDKTGLDMAPVPCNKAGRLYTVRPN
jgi:hypothetical protein